MLKPELSDAPLPMHISFILQVKHVSTCILMSFTCILHANTCKYRYFTCISQGGIHENTCIYMYFCGIHQKPWFLVKSIKTLVLGESHHTPRFCEIHQKPRV